MAGSYGELQIAATHCAVVLDVHARNWDTEGQLHQDTALAHLSISDAARLRDLLNEAIVAAENADPRQPGLWSDATARAIAGRMRKGRPV
jgi:hypothetical protein